MPFLQFLLSRFVGPHLGLLLSSPHHIFLVAILSIRMCLVHRSRLIRLCPSFFFPVSAMLLWESLICFLVNMLRKWTKVTNSGQLDFQTRAEPNRRWPLAPRCVAEGLRQLQRHSEDVEAKGGRNSRSARQLGKPDNLG